MKDKLLVPIVPVVLALGVCLVVAPLAGAATKTLVKNGVIHSCIKVKGKKSGAIRIVASAKQCKRSRGETALVWDQNGSTGSTSQGATGPRGPAGTNGTNGSIGATGKEGPAATVNAELEKVITEQTEEIEKLTAKVTSLGTEVLNLGGTLQGVEGTLTGALGSISSLQGGLSEQCTTLNEVSTQANGITSGVTELLGKLGGVVGLFQPNLPADTMGLPC